MLTAEHVKNEETLAEEDGMTAELAGAILQLAGEELAVERFDTARTILDGMVVTNPHDPGGWILLSQLHRRTGQFLAARVCAETATHLAPDEPEAKLVRAEALLGFPEESDKARAALAEIAGVEGPVGERAQALLQALA